MIYIVNYIHTDEIINVFSILSSYKLKIVN